MNLNGTPPTGYYLGNSVIDVKTNRAVLLIRRARVLNYAHLKCKDDSGLAFLPNPLVPVPPTVVDTSGGNCTPGDFARVKVENVGNRHARRFNVTSPTRAAAIRRSPSRCPDRAQEAWVVKAVQFNKKPGGCGGPYTARVAAKAGDGAATAASEILFQQVDLYTMKNMTDIAKVQSFLASN